LRYTLIVASFILFFYFLFSSSLLYILEATLRSFGFSIENPLSILTYTFVHVGPSHLIANLILLIAVGAIAEKKLSFSDYLSIYILSGATAAITFALLNPNTVLVGASASVAGLLMAAFIVDAKKAFFYTAAALILSSFVAIPLLSMMVDLYRGSLASEEFLSSRMLENVSNKKAILEEELSRLSSEKLSYEERFRQGKISEEEYRQEIANISTKEEQIVRQSEEVKEEESRIITKLNKVINTKENVEQGKQRESSSPSSALIHVVGAMTALLYLYIFKRDSLWKAKPYHHSRLERRSGKSKKRLKARSYRRSNSWEKSSSNSRSTQRKERKS